MTTLVPKYDQGSTGAVNRAFNLKLQEFVSVKDFGATGDGTTDDTSAIQAALNVGGKLYFPTGTYIFNSDITFSTNVTIDLCGSTLKRGSTAGTTLICTGTYFNLQNGIIDGNNNTVNFGHLLTLRNSSMVAYINNVTFQNNVAGYPTPTASINSDHINANQFSSLDVTNCIFNLTSRNGISITTSASYVNIANNQFTSCYLFGVDVEPDTSASLMYKNILISQNTFTNCGSASSTNYVWTNGGGPFAIHSPNNVSLSIVEKLSINDNIIRSISFSAPVGGVISPYIQVDSYQNLVFDGNLIENIDRTIIAVDGFNAPIVNTILTNNVWNNVEGTMSSALYCYYSKNLIVTGNNLAVINYSGVNVNINDNSFNQYSTTFAIKAINDTPYSVVICGNTFNGYTTVIDTTNHVNLYTIVSNQSYGQTTFVGGLTNSIVSDNNIGTGHNTVSTLPSGTKGQRSFVTDATVNTFGTSATGGGSYTVPVFYNGTTWIIG